MNKTKKRHPQQQTSHTASYQHKTEQVKNEKIKSN